MSKIIQLFPDADSVLLQSIGDFEDVAVMGWMKADGTLHFVTSTGVTTADLLYLIEKIKLEILNDDDDEWIWDNPKRVRREDHGLGDYR